MFPDHTPGTTCSLAQFSSNRASTREERLASCKGSPRRGRGSRRETINATRHTRGVAWLIIALCLTAVIHSSHGTGL